MSTNITIKNPTPQVVKVVAPGPDSIKMSTSGGKVNEGISEFSQLIDVDTSNVGDNYILIYDSSRSKYVMKPLSMLDGGVSD